MATLLYLFREKNMGFYEKNITCYLLLRGKAGEMTVVGLR